MNKINLENSRIRFTGLVNSTFKSWIGDGPDMFIISSDGHKIYTKKFLLSFYGSYLTSIPEFLQEDVGVVLEESSRSIISFLKILSSGLAVSDVKDDLLDVVDVAKSLGIVLDNWQIGSKRVDPSKKQSVIPQVKNVESLDQKPCSICGEKFETEEMVEKHTFTHFNESSSRDKCASCHLYFSELKYLMAHINIHHNDMVDIPLKYKVKDYGEGDFMILSKVKGDIPSVWSCVMCGKTYATGSTLRRHMIIHTGYRFKCRECGLGFSRKDNVRTHIKRGGCAAMKAQENLTAKNIRTIALYKEFEEPMDMMKKPKKVFETILKPRLSN